MATGFTVRPGSPAPALPRGEGSILEAARGRIGLPGSTSNSEYLGPPRVSAERHSSAPRRYEPASSDYNEDKHVVAPRTVQVLNDAIPALIAPRVAMCTRQRS